MADNSWEDELAWAGEWASNAHQQEGSMFQEHPEPVRISADQTVALLTPPLA